MFSSPFQNEVKGDYRCFANSNVAREQLPLIKSETLVQYLTSSFRPVKVGLYGLTGAGRVTRVPANESARYAGFFLIDSRTFWSKNCSVWIGLSKWAKEDEANAEKNSAGRSDISFNQVIALKFRCHACISG
jgi:hypothetical protein